MAEYIKRTEALDITTRTCGDYAAAWWEIRKLPAADVAPVRHGRWVTQDETRTKFMCSLCESKNYGGHEKFCPNCGATMDGGDSDAESV